MPIACMKRSARSISRRDHLVAAPLRRARDELLVPRVHLREVGEAALRERAQEVERRDGLVVALQHPLRVGHARLGARLVGVDDVAAEGGQLDAVDELRRRRARLRELPGDAPHLDDRQRRAVGEHGRHLQQDLQLLADRDRATRRGTTPRSRRPGAGRRGPRRPRRAPRAAARLAREDERRQLPIRSPHRGGRSGVGPVGLLRARPCRATTTAPRWARSRSCSQC